MKSVREIREECGVSRHMLQRYEKVGLIRPSGHNKYGHLRYDEEMVKRIVLIRFCQNLGYRLIDIKRIMNEDKTEIKKELVSRIGELRLQHEGLKTIIEKTERIVQVIQEVCPLDLIYGIIVERENEI